MNNSLSFISSVALLTLLSACAPSKTDSGSASAGAAAPRTAQYDVLAGKKAPLIVVTDPQGAVVHRFASLLDDVEAELFEGLALYDSALAPSFGVLTTLKGDRLLYVHDPANALTGASEEPEYEALVCLTSRTAQAGMYEGQAYDIKRDDRDAVLAIASGVNLGEDGAEAALTGGLSENRVLGKCVINVDNLNE